MGGRAIELWSTQFTKALFKPDPDFFAPEKPIAVHQLKNRGLFGTGGQASIPYTLIFMLHAPWAHGHGNQFCQGDARQDQQRT